MISLHERILEFEDILRIWKLNPWGLQSGVSPQHWALGQNTRWGWPGHHGVFIRSLPSNSKMSALSD